MQPYSSDIKSNNKLLKTPVHVKQLKMNTDYVIINRDQMIVTATHRTLTSKVYNNRELNLARPRPLNLEY